MRRNLTLVPHFSDLSPSKHQQHLCCSARSVVATAAAGNMTVLAQGLVALAMCAVSSAFMLAPSPVSIQRSGTAGMSLSKRGTRGGMRWLLSALWRTPFNPHTSVFPSSLLQPLSSSPVFFHCALKKSDNLLSPHPIHRGDQFETSCLSSSLPRAFPCGRILGISSCSRTIAVSLSSSMSTCCFSSPS